MPIIQALGTMAAKGYGGYPAKARKLSGTWTSETAMPINYAYHSTTTYNGRIYFAYDNGNTLSFSNLVYSYNGSSWQSETNLPVSKRWGKLVTYNNRIYAVGGGPNPFSEVYYYTGSGSWTAAASIPNTVNNWIGRDTMGIAAYNNKIYIFSGHAYFGTGNGDYAIVDTVFSFNGTSWNTGESNVPVRGLSWSSPAQVIKDKIFYHTAGYGGSYYSFDGTTYTLLSTVPTNETIFCAYTQHDSRNYILHVANGGYQFSPLVYSTDYYGLNWQVETSVPVSRQIPDASSLGGKIYVHGGMSDGSNRSNTIYSNYII